MNEITPASPARQAVAAPRGVAPREAGTVIADVYAPECDPLRRPDQKPPPDAPDAAPKPALKLTPAPLPAPAPGDAPPVTLVEFEPPPMPVSVAGGIALQLGDGFPTAPAGRRTAAEVYHDYVAGNLPSLYNTTVNIVLNRLSDVTRRSVGVDLQSLLHVERTMYQVLAGSRDGFVGGSTPIFQRLAEGQASFVNLGPGKEGDSEHIMRLFASRPLDQLKTLPMDTPELRPVMDIMLARAEQKQFPVFIDVDNNLEGVTATESIATESIASIARRENQFGHDFPDPVMYYQWLVTRIESNFRHVDPWLYATSRKVHDTVGNLKDYLRPPWLDGNNSDPFGSRPDPRNVQKAYTAVMEMAGQGPPTLDSVVRFADTAIALDRDLTSGIQTYWIKLLREVSPEQRASLMRPLARAWVSLNVLGPGHTGFEKVSPPDAPDIELIERRNGKRVVERYDRAMALSQVVDHTLDGLGIQERKAFMDLLMAEIRQRQPEIEAREQRLRTRLGAKYGGIDVPALLACDDRSQAPLVKPRLEELIQASGPDRPIRPMTTDMTSIAGSI